ncbi:MAG: hypothetical protein LQ337_002096 [Flavoplaca oasis]|nr:MAG: hypothetical protein LQ337_002096 [Flavoplaca oasis]
MSPISMLKSLLRKSGEDLVGLQQLAITAGIMISFWIDYATHYIGGTGEGQSDAAWLIPICLQLIPDLALGVGIFFMPFSPRWLVHHDREAEARRVLSGLCNLAQDDPLLELEFLEIKAQSVFEKRNTAKKWPHLTMFGRVTTATVTMFFQQFTGINAVLSYAPSIFEALGTTRNTTSLLATGIIGVAKFLATIPAVLYIEKLGRKPVMLAGSLGMGISHFTIAIIFAKNGYQWATHKTAGWAAVAMVCYETYIFYGLMTAGGALSLSLYVPETKRLTLEEMDVVFGSVGVARAHSARMQEINREIGLDDALRNMGIRTCSERSDGEGDVVLRNEEEEEIGVKA